MIWMSCEPSSGRAADYVSGRARELFEVLFAAAIWFFSGAAWSGKCGDLEDEVSWESVSDCRDGAEVGLYLLEFPSGCRIEAARACLEKIGKPDLVGLLGRGLIAGARDWETGWPDLHYAAAADLPDAVADLVGSGVPVDARLASGSPFLGKRLLEMLLGLGHGETFKGWRADGEMALMIATWTGSLRAAVALEQHGADIDAKDKLGQTPLHEAARMMFVDSAGSALDTARLLVECGADIHAKDIDGETPLQVA